MTTQAKVMKHLNELNATVNPYKDPVLGTWDAYVDAPHGFVWTHTGTHAVCIREASNKRELWKWIWQDVGNEGVYECDARPNCDVCDFDGEDE